MKLEMQTWAPIFRSWLARQPRSAVAGGAALLVLLAWMLYIPPWTAIRKLKVQQADLRAEMESAAAVLGETRGGSVGPLIRVDQAPEVLARIEALAQKHGLRFLEVSPGKPRAADPGQPLLLPLDLQIEGQYRALGEFLGRLRNAGELPAPVLVQRLQISRDEKLLPRVRARVSLEIAFAGGGNVPSE